MTPIVKRRLIAATLCVVAALYVGLFFHQRQVRSITFLRDGRFLVVWAVHFSERPNLNSVQYRLFYPLFGAFTGDPIQLRTALKSREEPRHLKYGTTFYVDNLDDACGIIAGD